jgi:hypothetical protein
LLSSAQGDEACNQLHEELETSVMSAAHCPLMDAMLALRQRRLPVRKMWDTLRLVRNAGMEKI